MTPVLTDTVTQLPGVHISPSLSTRSLRTDPSHCLDTSNTKVNCSSVVFAGTELLHLHKDFKPVEPLSSAHYKTLFLLTSSSGLNLENKRHSAWKTEQAARFQGFLAQKDGSPPLAESKVRRELFPGTVSKVLADVNKLWDITVAEAGSRHGLYDPKYRLQRIIEEESLALPFTSNSITPDLLDLENEPQNAADKERRAKLVFLKCLNRQQMLLNRAQQNQKRLRLLLATHAVEHCSKQISGFVNHQIETIKVHRSSASQPRNNAETDAEVLDPVGTASGTCMDFDNAVCQAMPSAVRKFSIPTRGLINHLARELDSDATESSSDEDWDEYSSKTHDCAEWDWLSVRAGVASRWTWLQAEISELEYKIQQMANLQGPIRRRKGTLVFAEPSDCIVREETHLPDKGILLSPAGRLAAPPEESDLPAAKDLDMSPSSPTLLLRNIEKQSAQLTEMVSSLITADPNRLSPTLPVKPFTRDKPATGVPYGTSGAPNRNGFCKQQPVKNRKRIRAKASTVLGRSSARTRPLRLCYKRNLYRLGPGYTPIHLAVHSSRAVYGCNESQQTANHSSTWISCDKRQNVCEIDPHFHPVLSFLSDLPLYLRLEALLNNNEDIKGDVLDSALCTKHEADRRPSRATAPWSKERTGRFRPCYETRSRERRHASAAEAGTLPLSANSFSHTAQDDDTNRTPSSQESAAQTPAANIVFSATRRKLRSGVSYDIDNIVIPMNLVAPTKVEKLQYKEILTPRWKEEVHAPLEIVPNEELEDLSDEAYSSRHQKYEQKEKARWVPWKENRWPKRSRYSGHSLGVWSANVLFCNEENCSPSSLSPVSQETLSPRAAGSQSLQSAGDLQREKVGCWERRVFPLRDAAAVALLAAGKPAPQPPTNAGSDSNSDQR
ncbi:KAT8 regulatory NSL complex subunit 1-like protein isoform X2 [Pseudophryne corroboree]|uniref:KAT8 regulatory NSL complex subunit 1-like protein isoform X2 n=1 Tax=Pseudophryne corroboree TaxID=495146 RepID=UPI0030815AB9